MKSEDQYIICSCGSAEHIIRLEKYNWIKDGKVLDQDLSISVHLSPESSIFKRIWIAIKYIFGHEAKFGSFEEILLDEAKAQQIIDFMHAALQSKKNEQ